MSVRYNHRSCFAIFALAIATRLPLPEHNQERMYCDLRIPSTGISRSQRADLVVEVLGDVPYWCTVSGRTRQSKYCLSGAKITSKQNQVNLEDETYSRRSF